MTIGADIWLLPSVRPNMHVEITCCGENVFTLQTSIGLLSGVTASVKFDFASCGEDFVTLLTFKCLLLGVSLLVALYPQLELVKWCFFRLLELEKDFSQCRQHRASLRCETRYEL